MKLFGLEISVGRSKGVSAPIGSDRGWFPWIREPFSGAWQNNEEWRVDTVLAYSAVFACVTLIASDIAKLRTKLVQVDADGIWSETTSPSFSPVLRKPNDYQNHIQFKEVWLNSKLTRGNTYVLKVRDDRGVVVQLYVLDPNRVQVLVSPDGSVFYELQSDNLSGLDGQNVRVPASEIIHDRFNCLFHPLCGLSPLFASGYTAWHGLKMQRSSSEFFGNVSKPGGVLIAPGPISDENAAELKAYWSANFTGQGSGKVAVLGDNLRYEPMNARSASEAQLIEQLRWTAEIVASTFHVPAYMIGAGTAPAYNNIEALQQQYYGQCLQVLIESFELCMREGLALPDKYDIELDLDGLLRMDTSTLMDVLVKGVGGGIFEPDYARRKFDLKPVPGGQTPYMQQQNYSLGALDRRDNAAPAPSDTPAEPVVAEDPAAKQAEWFTASIEALRSELETTP